MKAYRAARVVGASVRDEGAIFVFAGTAKVVTLDLDVKVELLGGGGRVLEDRKPFAVVLANTKVDRGPVADGLAAITPLATLLLRGTGRVDIVLSRSGLALPLVVGGTIRASHFLGLATVKADGDSLRFGSCLWLAISTTRIC